METTKILRHGLWLCALGALVACNETRPPRPAVAPYQGHGGRGSTMIGYTPGQGQAARDETESPTRGSVSIDERILRICGDLPEPHFEFDSAQIRDRAADHLQTVARCFTTGPLKGRSLKLVGRADPRGTEMYNMALGQDRAASVARFLEGAGIPAAHIRTMSRGELDATGTDEESWARDRRVDIVLGD